jgi:Domain of unknown function DUF87.
MQKKNNPFNERGTAMVAAAPITFGIAEALFHANPFVGGALAILASAIAYRHYDDVASGVETIASGALHDYTPRKQNAQSERADLPTRGITNKAIPTSILLGMDRKKNEVRRMLSELKSILILALPGQGKSTLASYLLAQIIEQGGRIAIIDRHARSDESLSAMLSPFEAAFARQPAYEPDNAMATLEYADDTLNARMDGSQSSDTPFILVIDEMTDILKKLQQKTAWGDVAKGIADVVEGFCAMGRKYNCFVLAIGQLSNASRTGGTEIRELFTTRLIGGMQESQARLVLPKEIATQCPNLQAGQWIAALEGKREPFKIDVPRLSKERRKQIAASIVRDPVEELAEMEDVDLDDSRYDFSDDVSDNVSDNVSTQFSRRNESNQAQNSHFSSETRSETASEKSGNDFVAQVRLIAKRLADGEKPVDIRKSLGITSGRSVQEFNQLVSVLQAEEGTQHDSDLRTS